MASDSADVGETVSEKSIDKRIAELLNYCDQGPKKIIA